MRQRESAASNRDSSGGGGLVVAPAAVALEEPTAAGGCGDFDGDGIARGYVIGMVGAAFIEASQAETGGSVSRLGDACAVVLSFTLLLRVVFLSFTLINSRV